MIINNYTILGCLLCRKNHRSRVATSDSRGERKLNANMMGLRREGYCRVAEKTANFLRNDNKVADDVVKNVVKEVAKMGE